MCQAIREMVEDGRIEGRKQGRFEGRTEGRKQGRLEGRTEGRVEGENRLSRLIAMMIADNCSTQIERVVSDTCFLQKMYLKYNV